MKNDQVGSSWSFYNPLPTVAKKKKKKKYAAIKRQSFEPDRDIFKFKKL